MSSSSVGVFKATLLSIASVLLFAPSLSQAGQSGGKQQGKVCQTSGLYDFAVYSLGSITATSSDYQGAVGAKGDIDLSFFEIKKTNKTCIGMASWSAVRVRNGNYDGTVETSDFSLRSATIEGNVKAAGYGNIQDGNVIGTYTSLISPNIVRGSVDNYYQQQPNFTVNHDAMASQMKSQSRKWSLAQADATVRASAGILTITAGSGSSGKQQQSLTTTSVASIRADQMYDVSQIVLSGSADQYLVINVSGTQVVMDSLYVELRGGLKPSHVLWNFYQATSLEIVQTKHETLGHPGTILAPNATLDFYEGLVTGSVLVGEIRYSPRTADENSGQVNWGPWTGGPAPAPVCGPNEHMNQGGSCVCDAGYSRNQNGVCVLPPPPPVCGPNEHLGGQQGRTCVCDAGYSRNQAGLCVLPPPPPVCGPNEHLGQQGKSCVCDTGYIRNQKGQCVRPLPPPPVCPIGKEIGKNGQCVCKEGTYEDAKSDQCIPIPVVIYPPIQQPPAQKPPVQQPPAQKPPVQYPPIQKPPTQKPPQNHDGK